MSKRFTKEQIANAMADYDAGLNCISIAKKHKISPTTLLSHRRKMGLPLRRDPIELRSSVETGVKKCNGKDGCGKTLPLSHFKRTKKGGYQGLCTECANRRSRNYFKTPAGIKSWRTVSYRKYGMTIDDYERMLRSQGGKCQLCPARPSKEPRGRLHIDHCHATGKVRSLLCSKCNTGIGLLRDSPALLRKAAAYIEHHSQQMF